MNNRPETTLFLLQSLDGKISTGDIDERDVDKDFPKIPGVKEGLQQYYEIEQTTDLHSLISGRVLAKVGINEPKAKVDKTPVSFIVIDNKPHLSLSGVDHLLQKCKTLYIVTTNKDHPCLKREGTENLEIIYYDREINFTQLFISLHSKFHIPSITLQTGGELNAILLREGLVDHVSIIVAPCLIGGKNTASLIDGKSLSTEEDLQKIRPLKFVSAKELKDSYIHLNYDVMN